MLITPKYWDEPIRAMAASGAPAAAARTPSPSVIRNGAMAAFSMSPDRALGPPAAWPVSWAMTPSSWLGLAVSTIRPVFTKIA